MAKFTELHREEEYYRKGVWKIFYRLSTTPVRLQGRRYNGELYWYDVHCDEIKFSGHDAEARSLTVFKAMQLEDNS